MDVADQDPDELAVMIYEAATRPTTVAEARALIRDPRAADRSSPDERAVAWMVALADRRIRRCGRTPCTGGTAA